MVKSLRILVVDDQLRTRQSLKALLTTKFPQAEIFEAANGAEAVHRLEELRPEVVLMDVLMPEMDGLTSTRLIKAIAPHVTVIVLSMYADYKASALAAGANAFISKGDPPDELLKRLADMAGVDSSHPSGV